MELSQLREFAAVARCGNMTKAAQQLSIAQPSLSKSIRHLEDELGAKLFFRSSRGMDLTHEGEILLQAAEEVFPLLDGAAREIRRSADGRTRIRVCLKSAADLISGMFTAFAVKRPQVLFDIADAPENCEVLIDSCVASELPSDAVVLLTEEICLAVSRDNPLSSRSLIPVQRLRSELFIDLTGSDSYREFFRQIFAGGPMPLTCARTVSYQLMKEFAALDMGVALAASVNWNASGAPANVKLVSIEGRPCRYIYLQERGKYCPECLTEFVEFLKDSFTAMQIKHPVRK